MVDLLYRRIAAATSLACAALLAACGNNGMPNAGFQSPTVTIESPNGTRLHFDLLPKNTIGEELPSEGVGSTKDPTWGQVGGFTQTSHAQVLAFPPKTTVTIENLSGSIPHTFNVVQAAGKPPAHFPSNPTLSFTPHGNGVLGLGYASGAINPGKSVKVKLLHAGTYLIGCAFHYSEGMQDVIRVVAGATPGPKTR